MLVPPPQAPAYPNPPDLDGRLQTPLLQTVGDIPTVSQRAARAASPWLRSSADPSMATTPRLGGAGGLSFVVGPGEQLYALLHAYRGGGQAPEARRVAWAFRVEPTGAPPGYRLIEVGRNHSAETPVNDA